MKNNLQVALETQAEIGKSSKLLISQIRSAANVSEDELLEIHKRLDDHNFRVVSAIFEKLAEQKREKNKALNDQLRVIMSDLAKDVGVTDKDLECEECEKKDDCDIYNKVKTEDGECKDDVNSQLRKEIYKEMFKEKI